MKKCTSCDAEVPQGAHFCPQCGAPATASAAKKSAKQQPAKNTMMRDSVVVVGALVVIMVGYFIFADREEAPKPPQQQQQSMGNDPHQGMDAGSIEMLNNLPNDFNALVNAGHTIMDQGNFALAAEAYKRALAINADAPDIRTDYGACLDGMGLPDRAIEEFRTVLKQNPDHAIANFNIGIVFYNKKEFDSTKVHWNNLLRVAPNSPAAQRAKELMAQMGQ